MDFQGTHEHTLDAKNRLTIPSGERHKFEDGVVLFEGAERCIEIWTPRGWDAFVDESLAGRSRLSADTRELSRQFGRRSTRTTLDTAGRVLLNERQIANAGLGRDVTLYGASACIEIWDRAAADAKDDERGETFTELAERMAREG